MLRRSSDIGNEVVLEDVRQLVDDEPVEQDRSADRSAAPCGCARLRRTRARLPGAAARRDVLLLELAVRLEDDERHALVEIVPQVRADLLIRALGVARDALEVALVLGVVVDLEVVGLVDVPLELVVMDLVLAVVRRELRLRVDGAGPARGAATTNRASPESAFARSTHLRWPGRSPRRIGRWKHIAGRACAYGHLVKLMGRPRVNSRDLTVITQLSQRRRRSKRHTTEATRNRWQYGNVLPMIYAFRPDLDTER